MQLQVVNIEDVYPDPNNPRKTFEGIEELADSFALNSERPGEPVIPPILVRNGGIYNIVDGERRYKALKRLKAKTFTANVCDDMDEANVLMAMLATDNKQYLTDLEKSRGVQQMLLLGVDPMKVEKVSRRSSSKIKKAMDMVQDAAEDLSLDRLLAIQEFEGDEEIVEKLTNCSEKDWRGIAVQARDDRAKREKRKVLMDAASAMGYTVLEAGAEWPDNFYYVESIDSVDDLEDAYDKDATVFVENKLSASLSALEKRANNVSEKAAQLAAEVSRIRDSVKEANEKRDAWFAEHISTPTEIPNLANLAIKAVRERNAIVLKRFEDDLQTPIPYEPCALVLAIGYSLIKGDVAHLARNIYDGKSSSFNEYQFRVCIDTLKAFELDGYMPDEWESELYDKIRAAVPEEGE